MIVSNLYWQKSLSVNLVIIIAAVTLVACSGGGVKTSDLQKIYGREMILPESGQWRVVNRDTTYALSNDKPKILVYYNAQGCTSCRLKELMEWKEVIDQTKNPLSDSANLEFIFVFATGSDFKELTFSLMQYKFDHPVLCDTKKEFEKVNLLPDNEIFHYFLLDKSSKVCLVGSPLNNPKMWELYKRKIAELN